MQTPEANPHAVFMPAPIGEIGLQHGAGRRNQNLARHGIVDKPVLDIDHGPDDQSFAVGQSKFRPICRRGIGQSLLGTHQAAFLE